MARRTVAVIGGGCAGVLVTRQLLRCSDDDLVLIEPDLLGGGPAYAAAQPWHLLNSRAGAMSADPDDPQHFVRWARAAGITAGPDDFLARRDYGRYLRFALAEAIEDDPARFTRHRARVTRVRPDDTGCTVELDDGDAVRADHVVLAVGSPAGAHPSVVPARVQDQPGYVGDPWRRDALTGVPGREPVLLIGTGLTAIDVALSLTSGERAGRSAPIVAVSRHGQVPQAHTAVASPPVTGLVDGSLRAIVRAVRERADKAGDWRSAVDGLRPYLDTVWTSLAHDEQEAFLRHLARFWESHRHRMAPSVAERIADLRATGALDVRSGGVRSIVAAPGGGFDVVLGDGAPRRFAAVVNCAGPGRLPGSAGPLVRDLIGAGLARAGAHGLGLDVDADGRLVGRDAAVQDRLSVVGPLRRGALWETTAVPELRAQAARLVTGSSGVTGRPSLRVHRTFRPREPRWDAA
jgi:uncharacterized NAD(P)/FAD-binding protein YdhS